MTHPDRILICRDCSTTFTFSAGEQSFYAQRGLLNQPQRCPPCRTARRQRQDAASIHSYVNYGAFASFGGRRARQMHPVSCSICGEMTEVPFTPTQGRPVFCLDCYPLGRQRAPGDGVTTVP